MAIAYGTSGNAEATASNGVELSPNCPATVNANDILLAHVCYRDTSTTPSTPSGWELLAGPESAGATPTGRHWVFGRIGDGTEDNTPVVFGTAGGTVLRHAQVYSFTGWVSGIITDVVVGFAHAADTTATVLDVAVTTTVAGALACQMGYATDDNNIANATNISMTGETGGDWISRGGWFTTTTGSDGLHFLQTAAMASVGTIDGGSVSISAADPWGCYGFEIRPNAPAGGAVTGTASAALTFTAAASGVPDVAGAAAGALTFTATANGVPGVQGQAAASLTFTGTAAGVPGVVGQAACTIAFTGAASGTAGAAPVQGQALAAVTFSGTAAGIPGVVGQAAAPLAFTGASTGSAGVVGAAAVGLTFAGTGAGVAGSTGQAAGALAFAAAASGVRGDFGTASAALVFTGSASGTTEGTAVTGNAIAAFVFQGHVTVLPKGTGPRGVVSTRVGIRAVATNIRRYAQSTSSRIQQGR